MRGATLSFVRRPTYSPGLRWTISDMSGQKRSLVTVVQLMGEKLRKAREREGLTLVQLAREAEISEKTLRRAEKNGERVKDTTRYKIINALNRREHRLKEYDTDLL